MSSASRRVHSFPHLPRFLLLALPALAVGCADASDVAEAEVAALALSREGIAPGHLARTVDIAGGKFIALAEAVPDEAWDWRPGDGVRAFDEVFLHVAADNWYGGALMGLAPPDDVGVTADPASLEPYQARRLDRAATVAELRRSFDFLAEALADERLPLDRTVPLGAGEVSVGDLQVRLTTHMHEHLGQAIAYARVVGIVPPWSR